MWNLRAIGGLALLCLSTLAMIGAGPLQKGVPPQPFSADYFSGTVYLGSEPAPAGIRLVACVDECAVFETDQVALDTAGSYNLLAIHPEDRRLRGREVSFYIVNQYGRIKAAETVFFEGGFNSSVLDLHFYDPLPLPLPPASLPRVGDRVVPYLPKVSLAVGGFSLAVGLVMLARRRRLRAELGSTH